MPSPSPAWVDLRARISAAAHRLGVDDPLEGLEDLFVSTFARPASDGAYRSNRFLPGSLPLEWSYAELDPDGLRIELQPFDPAGRPGERLPGALAALLPQVRRQHGEALAQSFADAVEAASRGSPASPEFGAFLGVVARPKCAVEFKVYVEVSAEAERLCGGMDARVVNAVPHFRSVAVGRGIVAERMYSLCRDGLRLTDLEALCATHGLAHRYPALLLTLLELTGGGFYLPPRSALIGLRQTERGAEVKVELVSGLAMRSQGLLDRVQRILSPSSMASFRRWTEIVCPEAPAEVPVRVVSVRAAPHQQPCLNLYAAEPGG